jgi:ribosomal protein S18 acetylase RimI-like enzyme
MQQIEIKSATENDVELLLSMIRELALWEGYSDEVVATVEILTESLFGESAVAKVLIAYLQEEAVGYLVYCPKLATYTGRNEIYLQDLYLRSSARGTGLGLMLMAELAKIARDSNASRIEWFVDKNNCKALAFYESIGADIVESIKVCRINGVQLKALENAR